MTDSSTRSRSKVSRGASADPAAALAHCTSVRRSEAWACILHEAAEIYSGDKGPPIDPTSPYAPIISAVDTRIAERIANGADPAVVASAILAAVDDPASPTRVLIGDDAVAAFDAHRRTLLAAWHAELAPDSGAG